MAIAILLFRKKMLPAFEHLHYILPDASIREDEEERPIARFLELIKEALQYQLHGRNWYVHGASKECGTPEMLRLAHNDNVSRQQVVKHVQELTEAYSWCLMPWGVNYAGQMIAFLSAEDTTFEKGLKFLQGTYYRDLHVSSYRDQEISEKRFRGGIFRSSSAEARAKGLWEYGRGSCDSVLALHYSSECSLSDLPLGAEIVYEAHGQQFGNPTRRRWIRVYDEAALLHYVTRRDRVLFTAPGLDERVMWLALQDYADIAESVNQDPLQFGLKALESTSWIYIPMNDDDKWDIYMNREPAAVSRFLESEELTHAPQFLHKYFC
jgi:hypothetical protein